MKIYECIISLLAGTGVFIAAMNMMSSNLQKVAGVGMRRLLGKITNNRFAGVGIGAVVTMIIQSSAATTVMTIGFVNAETMNLHQATAIIMGANIGTTITGILASLQSLNLSLYFSFLSFIGVVLMFFKKDILKNVGGIICGLGMIFIGLDIMSDSCKDDSIKSVFKTGLEKMDFPLALLLLGIVFTALMQSSSAMTGLIIVMVQGGSMEMGSALFIILGSNIGTCVTALISIIFTAAIWILKKQVIQLLGKITSQPAMQIAWFHVFFNVITTLILLPLINVLVIVACKIIKEKKGDKDENKKPVKAFKFINKRFLRAPDIAVEQIKKEIKNMAQLAKTNLSKSFMELIHQNNEHIEEVSAREDLIDFLNIEITKFLVKITSSINEQTAEDVSQYFHLLNDIERIGDHAKRILDESSEMRNKGIKFSQDAIDEFNKVFELLIKLFDIALKSFDNNTKKNMEDSVQICDEFKNCEKEYTHNHFERLSKGKCSMELGSFYTSAFAHFNSIISHLHNIIGTFAIEDEYKRKNTFNIKQGYLALKENSSKNQSNEPSTIRRSIFSENSISINIDNNDKNNRSIF